MVKAEPAQPGPKGRAGGFVPVGWTGIPNSSHIQNSFVVSGELALPPTEGIFY